MLLDCLLLGSCMEGGHVYRTVAGLWCLHTNFILGNNEEEDVKQGVVSTEGAPSMMGSSGEGGREAEVVQTRGILVVSGGTFLCPDC